MRIVKKKGKVMVKVSNQLMKQLYAKFNRIRCNQIYPLNKGIKNLVKSELLGFKSGLDGDDFAMDVTSFLVEYNFYIVKR